MKAAGLPVLIHCNGDYAIDIARRDRERLYASSVASSVNRIEFDNGEARPGPAHEEDQRCSQSFLMNHVGGYGAAYRDQIFGADRAAFTDPAGFWRASLVSRCIRICRVRRQGRWRARQHGGHARVRGR